jgi:hypothetical protein
MKAGHALRSRKMSSEASKITSGVALNAQVAAAVHVRDCDKCRHLFQIAYEQGCAISRKL